MKAIRIISEECVVLQFIQRFLQRQADDRVISERSIAFIQKIWLPILFRNWQTVGLCWRKHILYNATYFSWGQQAVHRCVKY